MHIRSILVPIDFSQCSRLALETADDWAERFSASLSLLHVHPFVDVPVVNFSYGQDRGTAAAACEALTGQLAGWADGLRLPKDRVGTEVVVGDPVEEIIKRTGAVDLAVLGTHGRSGVSRFLLGSVTERVVQGALCSVFIAKQSRLQPAQTAAMR